MTPRHSSKKERKPTFGHRSIQSTIINSAIGVLSLFLVAFIFSFSKKHTGTGVTIESIQMTFPNLPEQTKLAAEVFEENQILDVQVEVLNGCGTNGLAGHAATFLHSHQIDVVRSTDAKNYNYGRTLLISRTEHYAGLKEVASSLGFDVKDRTRVLIQPDASTSVDVTLILGKDYTTIKPLVEYIDNQL